MGYAELSERYRIELEEAWSAYAVHRAKREVIARMPLSDFLSAKPLSNDQQQPLTGGKDE